MHSPKRWKGLLSTSSLLDKLSPSFRSRWPTLKPLRALTRTSTLPRVSTLNNSSKRPKVSWSFSVIARPTQRWKGELSSHLLLHRLAWFCCVFRGPKWHEWQHQGMFCFLTLGTWRDRDTHLVARKSGTATRATLLLMIPSKTWWHLKLLKRSVWRLKVCSGYLGKAFGFSFSCHRDSW